MFIEVLIAGFGGGMVRGLVGFIKHQYSYKNVGFDLPYFLAMSIMSGAVGVLSAAAAKEVGLEFFGGPASPAGGFFNPAVAFFVGYSGGDFIENLVKTVLKTPTLYSLPNQDTEQE